MISDARNVSFRISLRWPIHIINPVDETKLSCYTSHRRSTTVSLETYSSICFRCTLSRDNPVTDRNLTIEDNRSRIVRNSFSPAVIILANSAAEIHHCYIQYIRRRSPNKKNL